MRKDEGEERVIGSVKKRKKEQEGSTYHKVKTEDEGVDKEVNNETKRRGRKSKGDSKKVGKVNRERS